MPSSTKTKKNKEDFSADVFFFVTPEDEDEAIATLSSNIKRTVEDYHADN